MENKDLIAIVTLFMIGIFVSCLIHKKAKVESEKDDLKQEMLNRKHELQEQPSDYPIDVLCQGDPQYAFMQDLLNQVNVYLDAIDFGLIANLIPLVFVIHNAMTGTFITPSQMSTSQNSRINESITSPLMPRTLDYTGLAETNAQVYLERHFDNTSPITTYLQKRLIGKCISNKAVDHWNLIQNLDKHFLKKNIGQNERNHIMMAAINVYKIKEPQIGLISNQDFQFSRNGINIAQHLATICLLPDYKFNPFLDMFTGISKTVGGDLIHSNLFLDKLERTRIAKQRARTMDRHFNPNR